MLSDAMKLIIKSIYGKLNDPNSDSTSLTPKYKSMWMGVKGLTWLTQPNGHLLSVCVCVYAHKKRLKRTFTFCSFHVSSTWYQMGMCVKG